MQTAHFKIFIADDQTYFGRLVIVLRRPCRSLGEMSAEEWVEYGALVKKIESFYRKTYKATMFNWSCLMNDAAKEGKETQVHFHMRPRYKKAISVEGEQFADPNFGYHYIPTFSGIKHVPSKAAKKHLENSIKNLFA